MKYYVCKKIRLLEYLQDNGFNFIKIQEDRNNPNRLVWIFIKSQKLLDCIEDYYNRNEFINRDKQ